MVKLGVLLMYFNMLQIISQGQQVEALIHIKNIKKAIGNMMVLVEDATGKEVLKKIIPVEAKDFKYELTLPTTGKYAISVYQDANKNKKLDKNFWGAPTELYGFSNNPKVSFSAPSLQSKLIAISTKTTITIFLK